MENISQLQFWAGIIAILIPNIYLAYNSYLTHKATVEAARVQAKVEENKTDTEAQDRLFTEYDRQINNLRRVEDENKELRPLALKNAILERDIAECKKDKLDWKAYAQKLAKQLEELGHVPLPFRRLPSEEDTQEKIPTIRPNPNEDPNKLQVVKPIKDTPEE